MRSGRCCSSALVVVTTLLLLFSPATTQAASLTGTAVDLDGKGVDKVTVRVLADGKELATTKTDREGKFSIKVDDKAVVSLEFSTQGRDTVLLKHLNGRVDQQISVVVVGGRG